MLIKVRFFRGAIHADLQLEPIALVTGKNGAGKSSVCQAVAAALNRTAIPFFRSSKPDTPLLYVKDAPALVYGGKERGGVLVEHNGGRTQISWPKNDIATDGTPPTASKVASGLITPVDMEERDRSRFFSTILNTRPTKDDWANALNSSGLVADQFPKYHEETWSEIEIQGFEAVYTSYRAKSTKLTGQWEGVTHERFGDKKAEKYFPEGWVKELAEHTIESHEEVRAQARESLERAIAKSAVSDAELEQFTKNAAREEEARTNLERAKKALSSHETEINRVRKLAEEASAEQGFACAHCNGVNLIRVENGRTVVEATDKTEEEIEQSAIEAAKAKDELKKSEEKLRDLQRAVGQGEVSLTQYAGSTKRLETARSKQGSSQDLDYARDFSNSIENQHRALERKTKADEIYREYVEVQTIITILEPKGLRQEIMVKKLAEFNQTLAHLCSSANFGQVSVTDDLDVQYNGLGYFLLSESEKYRCRVILQIATAMKDGSAAVVIDGADIMDQGGRNGLFSLLSRLQLKALVALTLSKRDMAPDLAKHGLGNTYWMEEGEIRVPKAAEVA